MRRGRVILAALLLLLSLGLAGCDYDYRALLPGADSGEVALIRVHIRFTDQAEIPACYVKSLGIDPDAEVYSGGPSMNYLYDRDGNVIGSYNYQNVLYITVLPEETGPTQ